MTPALAARIAGLRKACDLGYAIPGYTAALLLNALEALLKERDILSRNAMPWKERERILDKTDAALARLAERGEETRQ